MNGGISLIGVSVSSAVQCFESVAWKTGSGYTHRFSFSAFGERSQPTVSEHRKGETTVHCSEDHCVCVCVW